MYSLRRRLVITSILLLIVFFGAMTWMLNRAFEDNIESNAHDFLRTQILLLIADLDVEGGQVLVPERVSEPRLSQADGTLFAQINSKESVLWRSPSLLDTSLPKLKNELGVFEFYRIQDWQHPKPSYAMTLGVEWETEEGDLPFTILVAEDAEDYLNRLARYQRQFLLAFLIGGVALVLLLLMNLGWGLKPLQEVSDQVKEVELGDRTRLDEDFPLEVSVLTQNLNQLLNYEEQRIAKQKDVLGNLAHSLKTPITVLGGLRFVEDDQETANEQLAHMQSIIEYQLQSASAVGRRKFAQAVEVREISQQLVNSLQKIYRDKKLEVALDVDPGTVFYGDLGDWTELLGNLADNAFKWAESKVVIEVSNSHQSDEQRASLQLLIVDDGPGIDRAARERIMQRGVRLDSQEPGSQVKGHGIGLNIVQGIVDAYDGHLEVMQNQPSGAKFFVSIN